jgi:DNA polymerase-3 subunit gamma/tau
MNLYNKYRPRTFEEMVGNETAIQTMGKAIKKPNHSHTYLLSGPPGTGKTTIARIMATMLGASDMDIREINTASNRGIDTAREIIQQMRLNPMFGKTIVYILDECHKFTPDMQHALLKPLEDTPEHVYFFLCTTDPNKLIAAIKSRCTAIKTVLLKPEQLTIIIKRVAKLENIKLTGEMIELIADHAKGSPRKALVELERIAVLESEKERKDFIEGDSVDEEDADVSKLFGVLLRNKSGWVEVADVLKLLSENGKMDNADDIRYAIMGMANSMLLNGKMVKRNAIILEAFSDVNYNSGKFGLTLACLRVTIPG